MIRGLALCVLLLAGCAELGPAPGPAPGPASEGLPPEGYVFDDDPAAAPEAAVAEVGEELTEETVTEALGDESEPAEDAPAEDPPVVEPERPDLNAAARAQCARRKGSFTKSSAGAFFCVTRTRDGNKSCTRARDCAGACLARSGTCAPLTPLVGCHEVRTNTGARATVCID